MAWDQVLANSGESQALAPSLLVLDPMSVHWQLEDGMTNS